MAVYHFLRISQDIDVVESGLREFQVNDWLNITRDRIGCSFLVSEVTTRVGCLSQRS